MTSNYIFYSNIHDLYILLNQRMEQVERNVWGLSYGQYHVLQCIAKRNGHRINQRQLVRETCLRRPTVSQHLKCLCAKGYIIHTIVEENHRCKEISITESGQSALIQMDSMIDSMLEQLFMNLQIENCNQLLNQVKNRLTSDPQKNKE